MDKTMSDWQTTQVFLSDTGVHEVEISLVSGRLRCNCPGYSSRSSCKHARFVDNRMNENGGVYPVEISNSAKAEYFGQKALENPEEFRKYLYRYGRVEVI